MAHKLWGIRDTVSPKSVLVTENYDKRNCSSTGKIFNLSVKKHATGHLKHALDMVHLGGDGKIVSLEG